MASFSGMEEKTFHLSFHTLSSGSFHDITPETLELQPSRRHKSATADRMKHKCATSLHNWICVNFISGDFCSQKAVIFSTMRQRQLQRIDPIHPGTGGPFGSKHKRIFFPVDNFQNRCDLNEREKSAAGSEIKVCGEVLSKAFPVFWLIWLKIKIAAY